MPVPPQRRGDSTYHRADLHSSPDPASSLPGGRSGTPSYNAEPRPLTQSIGGSVEAPDYWIVSTRRCSQEGRPHCPAGTYDYFHVGPGGRPQFLDEPSFQAWLTPGVPVCVVVHGSFTNWSDAVEGSARMSEWIRSAAPDRPLHVVFFTWPSEGDEWWLLPPVNVGVLGRRAEFNGFYLADLISRIPPAHPVSLFGHSHGARVVTSAVHLKAGGLVQGQRLSHAEALGRRYRVVLAAAAVDQHWLSPGGRYACAMARVERLVNLRNRNDIALAVYPLRRVLSGLPLGRSGFRPIDRAQFRRLGLAVAELDVTGLLDTGHLWDNYYRRPEIARSIAPYLYFTDAIGPAAAPAGPRTFEFETSPPASGPRLPQQGSSSPGPAILVP
ncbi:MAG TPA: alpha/beta hydrolase [Planctomycetaceae bacterium]|nr:alpha/beta hydrolase [Planctomycetaceae bacterium]